MSLEDAKVYKKKYESLHSNWEKLVLVVRDYPDFCEIWMEGDKGKENYPFEVLERISKGAAPKPIHNQPRKSGGPGKNFVFDFVVRIKIFGADKVIYFKGFWKLQEINDGDEKMEFYTLCVQSLKDNI